MASDGAQGPKEENEHYQATLKRANSANMCGSFQEARELFLAVYALSTAPRATSKLGCLMVSDEL
jgi:hypothetical protein